MKNKWTLNFALLAIFTLVAVSNLSFAEDIDARRAWFGVMGKISLEEKVFFHEEIQLRYDTDIGSMQQTLMRFGPLWQVTPTQQLGGLLCFVQTGLTKEYRVTPQHLFTHKFSNNSNLSMRSRLEYRDVENIDDNSLRFRWMLRWQYPIFEQVEMVTWNEAFINVTEEGWTDNRRFERNRYFLGSKFTFGKIGLEIGYLNQFIPRHRIDTMEHIGVVYLVL